MTERDQEISVRRVLLVERDNRLREAIESVLEAEGIAVVRCATLEELVESTAGADDEVALLAWTAAGGLLGEDQRPRLRALSERVPLVLMVPSSWRKLVTAAQLGVAGVLAKPFGADVLLAALQSAAGAASTAPSRPSTLETAP